MRVLAGSAATLVILTACGRPIERAEVPGTYRSEYDFATTELTLSPDGTFFQEVRLKSGETAQQKGVWRYDTAAQRLTLDECLDVNDGFRRLNQKYRTPMVCNLPVGQSSGRQDGIRLGSEEGTPYWKVALPQALASP
jgi:hypothetical protein